MDTSENTALDDVATNTAPTLFPVGSKAVKKALNIPEKLYFKIGEVAKLIGVEPYVLRYWETEFPQIVPVKSKTNQRMYKRTVVETIVAIRDLLYDQKFTIEGARKKMGEIRRKSRRDEGEEENLSLDLDTEASTTASPHIAEELRVVIAEMDEFLNSSRDA